MSTRSFRDEPAKVVFNRKETLIPQTDHRMPDVDWVDEAWGNEPGTLGWIVGQVTDWRGEPEPGSLLVRLTRETWFSRKYNRPPRELTAFTEVVFAEQISHLSPEQTADLAVFMANKILEKIRDDLPRKTDVNGLTNVRVFTKSIEHS